MGSTSCGCFGSLNVRSWVALVIDFVCVFFLWWIRPLNFAESISNSYGQYYGDLRKGRNFLRLVGFALIGLASSFLIGTSTGRDMTGLPTYDRLVAPVTYIESGPPDSWVEGEVQVINQTNIEAKVMGSKTSCGCVQVTELISAIPADESVLIPFRLLRPKLGGEFRQQMTLYIDHPQQYFVNAIVVGKVNSP